MKNSFDTIPHNATIISYNTSTCPPGYVIANISVSPNNLRLIRNVSNLTPGSGDNSPVHTHTLTDSHTHSGVGHNHSTFSSGYGTMGSIQVFSEPIRYYNKTDHNHYFSFASCPETTVNSATYPFGSSTNNNTSVAYAPYIKMIYCTRS